MKARGLASEATPLLGGLAIFAGTLIAALLFMPDERADARDPRSRAAFITLVGAWDDARDLPPGAKLAGQLIAALILVNAGVVVHNITFPFLGAVEFGDLGGPLTVLGLVAIMNVVNFSDGVDGLAAGVCAISAIAFAIIAFDLGPRRRRRARRDHRRRRARLPRPQLPSRRRSSWATAARTCSACCSAR